MRWGCLWWGRTTDERQFSPFHFRNACLSPAEISTLIPFLIPGKTGIWWEGNAAEGFCADGDTVYEGRCVCERERKGCVGRKVPEFLITRGQSDSSGHLSWKQEIKALMKPPFKMQLFYSALVINSFSDNVLIKRSPWWSSNWEEPPPWASATSSQSQWKLPLILSLARTCAVCTHELVSVLLAAAVQCCWVSPTWYDTRSNSKTVWLKKICMILFMLLSIQTKRGNVSRYVDTHKHERPPVVQRRRSPLGTPPEFTCVLLCSSCELPSAQRPLWGPN